MKHTAPAAPSVPRRRMLQLSDAATALCALDPSDAAAQAPPADDLPSAIRALQPMTEGVAPIGADEHRGRLARAQALLAASGLDAVVVGPGSSLRYFAGAEWGLSERFLGFVLRRTGDPVWIAPAFERDRAREQICVGTDVRTWEEDESPYAMVAQALKQAGANGRVCIEETMPFAFSDGIAQTAPALRFAVNWKNRWWGVDATVGNRLWFTDLFQPQAWYALFYIDIPFERGDEIQALSTQGDTLVVFGSTKSYLILGVTSLDFEVRPSAGGQAGALGPRAVEVIGARMGLAALGEDQHQGQAQNDETFSPHESSFQAIVLFYPQILLVFQVEKQA